MHILIVPPDLAMRSYLESTLFAGSPHTFDFADTFTEAYKLFGNKKGGYDLVIFPLQILGVSVWQGVSMIMKYGKMPPIIVVDHSQGGEILDTIDTAGIPARQRDKLIKATYLIYQLLERDAFINVIEKHGGTNKKTTSGTGRMAGAVKEESGEVEEE